LAGAPILFTGYHKKFKKQKIKFNSNIEVNQQQTSLDLGLVKEISPHVSFVSVAKIKT
jgi:hypothetical protein